MTIREASEFLSVSEMALRRRIERGGIPSVRISPRSIRVKSEDLEKIVEDGYTAKKRV